MNLMKEKSFINFLNQHEILWQPVNLSIRYDKTEKKYKKDLIPMTDMTGKTYMPTMNDFKDLSKEEIKLRQCNNNFEFIAVDTSHYMHIDIDTPDYPEYYNELMQSAPYIKSITKPYGKHILITSDEHFDKFKNRIQFLDKGVELLCGQWSYARLEMFNADKPPVFIDAKELTEALEEKPIPLNVVKKVVNEDKDKSKYVDLLFNVIQNNRDASGNPVINYDTWFNIMCALKSNGFEYDIFEKWTKLYDDKANPIKQWNSLKQPYGTLFLLQKLAKEINPQGYKQWLTINNITISLSTLNKGAFDVAKWMAPLIKDDLVYCDGWYYCTNGLWSFINVKPVSTVIEFIQRRIDDAIDCINYKLGKCNDDEKESLENNKKAYFKHYVDCNKTNFYNTVITCLAKLINDETFINKLDNYTNKIYYKNGMYDLLTLQFREKIYAHEYVSKTLNFDFEEPSIEDIDYVRTNLLKICNWNEEHLNYYLSTIGYSLTGNSQDIQEFYYLRGQTAGNGKSVIFEALTDIMPNYVKKAKIEVFDINADVRKSINSWKGVRLLWVDEMTTQKKNNELLKNVANGTCVDYDKLYSTSSISMDVKFKLFLLSNHTINTDIDDGVKRRMKMMQFNSLFRSDYHHDDFENLEFKVDIHLQTKLQTTYKHALLKLFFIKSREYLMINKLSHYPEEWQKATNETIDDNDTFKEFFYDNFTIDINEMVHKDDFNDIMKTYYGNNVNLKKVKDAIARLRVKVSYQSQKEKTINNKKVKGYWVGLKINTNEE